MAVSITITCDRCGHKQPSDRYMAFPVYPEGWLSVNWTLDKVPASHYCPNCSAHIRLAAEKDSYVSRDTPGVVADSAGETDGRTERSFFPPGRARRTYFGTICEDCGALGLAWTGYGNPGCPFCEGDKLIQSGAFGEFSDGSIWFVGASRSAQPDPGGGVLDDYLGAGDQK